MSANLTPFKTSEIRESVQREICNQLSAYTVNNERVTGDTVILRDLAIDFLAVMDLFIELEDKYDVSIPMNRAAEIHTVNDMVGVFVTLYEENKRTNIQ